VIRSIALAGVFAVAPIVATAHQLSVFASVDCEAVLIEAKFSNGNAVQQGEVRILDGQSTLLITQPIGEDGTLLVPLDSVDHSEGLLIEVDTGSHDNYWIVTPQDITRSCQS